jgi:hypothetical protein
MDAGVPFEDQEQLFIRMLVSHGFEVGRDHVVAERDVVATKVTVGDPGPKLAIRKIQRALRNGLPRVDLNFALHCHSVLQ